MAVHDFIAKVTNSKGNSANAPGHITTIDPPVISNVTVVPDPALAGTLRTITITATDPAGLALTYALTVDGVAATAVAGQPNVFTFTV